MARSSYKIFERDFPYLLTCSTVGWLPLFSIPPLAEIVLQVLEFQQVKRGMTLYAYVVMENHIHLIAQSADLSESMRRLKSFSARESIDYLKRKGHHFYLAKLKEYKLAHHIDSEYQFWQEGFHPKQIAGSSMLAQKLEYVHMNPVKRGYIDLPEHWRYSSARNYVGMDGMIPVTLAQ